MPSYLKGRGQFTRKRKWTGFHDVQHLTGFLTRTNPSHKYWKQYFQEPAKLYKQKTGGVFLHPRSLRAVATKAPSKLAGDVLSEMKQYKKGDSVGGGLGETLFWFADQASNLLGFKQFREWVGAGYEHRTIPKEQQIFAKCVDASYMEVGKRPAEVDGLVRLPEYDQSRYSVWRQPNGQLLVSIRGTQLSGWDAASDAAIALGGPVESIIVQELFNKLDREGIHYDIASHSLGTQFVQNGTHENADSIYLYSPASSPLMDADYLKEQANDESYTYFLNESDGVSEAYWHQMTDDYVNNHVYVAPYAYSPLQAHSVSQYYPDLESLTEEGDDGQMREENKGEGQ